MLQTIATATPVVVAVALGVGYPLVAFLRRCSLNWLVILAIVAAVGLALGLVPLAITPFIPGLSEYTPFIAMYTSAIGFWCATGGQLIYHLFRLRPFVVVAAGAVVVALAIAGWVLNAFR